MALASWGRWGLGCSVRLGLRNGSVVLLPRQKVCGYGTFSDSWVCLVRGPNPKNRADFGRAITDLSAGRGAFSSPRHPYPLPLGPIYPRPRPSAPPPPPRHASTTPLDGSLTSRHGYAVPDAAAAQQWWRRIRPGQRIQGAHRDWSHMFPGPGDLVSQSGL
jgi:hypothetical protein